MSKEAPMYDKPSPADMADAHHRRWVEAGAPAHGISQWIPADKELPGNMRCVLATDMECHFIAIYESDKWICATTSDEIDSHITHWMELPEAPSE